MANTALQACGWVLGLLAWGAVIGMLMSEKWRESSISGDMGSAIDSQSRHEGLWSTCSQLPSGETTCFPFGIEFTDVSAVVIGCRALTILSIIFGIVGAGVILCAFKCTSHGPQGEEEKATLGRYGGAIYLMCGICVTVAGAWYVSDVYTTIVLPDPRGEPMNWVTGEGVQVTLAAGIVWLVAAVAVMIGSRHHHRNVTKYEHKLPLHQEYI